MKHKKLSKSLTLKKSTIAHLDLKSVKGGLPTDSLDLNCMLSNGCLTFDPSGCPSMNFPGCQGGSTPCA